MERCKTWGPLVLHVVAVIHYMVAEHNYGHSFELPNKGPFEIFYTHGGRYKFLTVLNMFFQAIFFWICLLNDIFGTNDVEPVDKPFLRKLRDFLHAAIGFPLSLFVGLSFWTLWMVDRELVYPKALDVYFPVWINHTMHTSIMVYTVLHSYICYNKYPPTTIGLYSIMSVVCVYVSWILLVYLRTGMWVYPIFEILTWPQRIVFLTVSIIFLILLYLVGVFINCLIWGSETEGNKYEKVKKSA